MSYSLGGAVRIFSSNEHDCCSTLQNNIFRHNQCSDRGGALNVAAGYLVIDQCVFEENSALSGGAIAIIAGIPHGVKIQDGVWSVKCHHDFRMHVCGFFV